MHIEREGRKRKRRKRKNSLIRVLKERQALQH
jgi:hypothetical protein